MKIKYNREKTKVIEDQEVSLIKEFNLSGEEKDFYFTFVQSLSSILKIKQLRDIQVLSILCMFMEYNSNRVNLVPSKRKEALDLLGISSSNFAHSLNRLKGLKIIDGDRGEYKINPLLFWKGSREIRKRLLREEGLEIRLKFKTKKDEDTNNG